MTTKEPEAPREWTTTELTLHLTAKKVPPDTYAFYGQRDGAVCLGKAGDEWLVYHFRQGVRRELAWARTEAQALEYLRLFVLEAQGLL